jgi:hemolysin activation/secretion protein
MFRSSRLSGLPLTLTLFSASHALAQTPPDAGQILRQQQPQADTQLERLPATENASPRPAQGPADGLSVTVRRIRFSGHAGLAEESELQAEVAHAIGKTLGMAQIQQLAENIGQYLKRKGWFLARAYLPEQDITDGDIEIVILPGRIEGNADGQGLRLETELRSLKPERIRKTVARALFDASNTAAHGLRLERALLLLNDLPGISARATLEKGDTPGSTRVVVQATEGPIVSGNVGIDNQGNRYTGSERVNAQLAVNSPLGIGDQATLTASASERLSLAGLGYSLPLGHDGWRLSMAHFALRYRIGEEFASLDSKGSADTTQLGLSYPIVRSRERNLYARLGYEHKALRDEQLGTTQRDRRIDNLSLGLAGDSYDQYGGGGLSNYNIGLTHGDADLSRIAADVTADANVGAAGSFNRLNYSLARLQKLGSQLSLFASASGQLADGNLASSEKFILGGPGGVRAYPVGEAAGDKGVLGTLELRYDVPGQHAGANLQLQGFVDAGHITLNHSPWPGAVGSATGRNSYGIAGAGLGLSLNRIGVWNLRALWATRIGDNPGRTSVTGRDADGLRDRSRFWINAMLWF